MTKRYKEIIQSLHKLKATREEIAEIFDMVVYTGGSPSLMYTTEELFAFTQIQGEVVS